MNEETLRQQVDLHKAELKRLYGLLDRIRVSLQNAGIVGDHLDDALIPEAVDALIRRTIK